MNPVLTEESKIEMSKLTCKQFTAYDKDNMGIIMMWLEGYSTKEDEDAVIDFGKMAGDTAHLIVYYGDHPDHDNHQGRRRGAGRVESARLTAGLGFSRLCHDMRA